MNNLLVSLDEAIIQGRAAQIDFLRALIQARSANPFTPEMSDPAAPIEREVALLIADRLRMIGLEPELRGLSPDRPNVIAVLRGVGESPAKRALILNGHMDTVLPAHNWTRQPFGAEIAGKRLYGLGALDMKASLAIFVEVARVLIASGVRLHDDLILTFVVDEEPGGCSPYGTTYLLEQGLTGTAAIVAEPENKNITIGHRGGWRFKLTVHGEAAHTGLLEWEQRRRGRSAISDMARVITALDDLELPYHETPAFPGRKPVFTFPTLIQGGTAINMVPSECVAYGDARLLPGGDAAQIEQLVRARLDTLPDLVYTLETLLAVPPVQIDPAAEIVSILARRTTEITGQEPTKRGCGPWNDGWMFMARGIPAVCGFGPNGAGVHSADEYVDLDSVIDTTRILVRAVLDYCGFGE